MFKRTKTYEVLFDLYDEGYEARIAGELAFYVDARDHVDAQDQFFDWANENYKLEINTEVTRINRT